MSIFPSSDLFPSDALFPGIEAPAVPRRSAGAVEIEITTGRRAFMETQRLFSGGPIGKPVAMSVGWHDTSVNAETGAFAVVAPDHADLVGEIVRVTSNRRAVYVYVLDVANVPVQVSLTRRVFLVLNRLTIAALPADVVAVG